MGRDKSSPFWFWVLCFLCVEERFAGWGLLVHHAEQHISAIRQGCVFYVTWIESNPTLETVRVIMVVSHGIAYPLPTGVNKKIYELARGMKSWTHPNWAARLLLQNDHSDLGKLGLIGCTIDTGDCKPPKQPPCRVPSYQQEVIHQQLEELLATGRIEKSKSPWSSPVVPPRKHDGTYRMCIEYCKLNHLSTEDSIPLSQMDNVLGG